MNIKTLQVGGNGTNCYLLEDETSGAAAVIDPGDEGDRILRQAQADGVRITCILLTHGHYDHTGGIPALRAALPEVPVYLHPADASMLGSRIMPLIEDTQPYGEGDTISVGGLAVKVLHTPGHTPGGVTLQAGGALFTGDTLFQGSMGRTDLPGGSERALMDSLRRLAALEGDYQVLPGHMGHSTLERERQTNYCLMKAVQG